MLNFNPLKIQNKIEEKRLTIGFAVESFLLKKLRKLQNFLAKTFSANNSATFAIFAITALSLFVQSNRDIGHDSATYIEVAQKMLKGGIYYQDFFELNFPLSFYLTVIPVAIAQMLAISPIITVTIFVNLLGIIAVFLVKNILKNHHFENSKLLRNLIIISLAASFFLRPMVMHFNEFFTKTSYFLIFFLPYFALQIIDKKTKSAEIFCGILAALIIALKPNYALLIAIVELYNLSEKRSIKSAFCLRNFTTLTTLIIYFLVIFFWQNDYLQYFQTISQTYFLAALSRIEMILKQDIFPLICILSVTSFLIFKNKTLQKFYLFPLAACSIVASEMIGGFDQRFLIYSLSLPTLTYTIFLLIRNKYFDFHKHGIFLIIILLISQFDAKNIFTLSLDLTSFWFVFVLYFRYKNGKNFNHIFCPNNFANWLIFLVLTAITITLIFANLSFQAWLFSAIIFSYFLYFQQGKYLSSKLSLLSASVVFLVLSFFMAAYISAIFNFKSFHEGAYSFKSPNSIGENIIKISRNLSEEQNFTIISRMIPPAYPAQIYLQKENKLPSFQLGVLFYKIGEKPRESKPGEIFLFERVKQQIADKNNNLLFIEVENISASVPCQISFLEYYLRDPEFRKIFLENYRFLTRFSQYENDEKNVNFYKDDFAEISQEKSNKLSGEFEVYVRK